MSKNLPTTSPNGKPFWQTKPLTEMSQQEWESLCDGCARCCLVKIQYMDSDEVFYTDLACNLLDTHACRCTNYARRAELNPACVILTPEKIPELSWMPKTCAYRRIAEGKDLAWWHPLVSGDPNTVHSAGISVRGRVIREEDIDPEDLEDHVGKWDE